MPPRFRYRRRPPVIRPHRGGRALKRFSLSSVGLLADITGVYVATHSVLITVIAAAMALMVAAMVLIFWR